MDMVNMDMMEMDMVEMDIRVHRIFFVFDFYLAHTFFSVFFNSKNNLFSYIF